MTYQAEEVVISELVEPDDPTVKIVAVDSDVVNFNLRTAFLSAYSEAEPGDTVICEVRGGVVIGSEETTLPAFRTGTGWPSGIVPIIRIEPNAQIVGRGGIGGAATADQNGAISNHLVREGGAGGLAMLIETTVNIDNQGTIGGGGGGGGGAASGNRRTRLLAENVAVAAASGGGGGQGFVNSLGGSATATARGEPRTASDAKAGQAGTLAAFGEGILASASRQTRDIFGQTTARASATGGNGGALGQAGGTGSGTQATTVGDIAVATGGAAGPAVNGDSLVTYISLGTILGARIN
jgi:hypothetical protein